MTAWKLVPVEPTKKMLTAGWSSGTSKAHNISGNVWDAMLSAAPDPPPYELSEAEVRAACEQIDALLEKIMTAKHGFVYATMDTALAALIAADKARREGGR